MGHDSQTLKMASICMNSTADYDRNVRLAEALVRKAASHGADWVMLPEMFSYYGPYDKLFDLAEFEGGSLYTCLSSLATELRICLFAGTVNEKPNERELAKTKTVYNKSGDKTYQRVYNTLYVFDRCGKLVEKYRKTHLFNLFDHQGKRVFCEEDGYIPGQELKVITLESFTVGLAICFEVRFPGVFAKIRSLAYPDILAIPAAFTLGTGMDHWELLLRARAVEHLCYVFAANQTGAHSSEPGARASYGHSMIIDPWGHKLADTGDDNAIAIATISRDRIKACRLRLPITQNERPELYE